MQTLVRQDTKLGNSREGMLAHSQKAASCTWVKFVHVKRRDFLVALATKCDTTGCEVCFK